MAKKVNNEQLKLLGKRIRQLRLAKGLSQEELAFALGWKNFSYISDIERGVKPVGKKTLKKLCEFFGVQPYELTLPEDAPVASDDLEKKFLYYLREAKRLNMEHVAMELCNYLIHRVELSKKPQTKDIGEDDPPGTEAVNK